MWFVEPNIKKMAARQNVRGLVKALTDRRFFIARDAAKALGDIGDCAAIEPLVQALGHIALHRDSLGQIGCEDIGSACAVALGNIGADAFEPVCGVLRSKEAPGREYAVRALGEIADPRAVKPLIEALHEQDNWALRTETAKALGSIGDARAVDPLVQVLEDWPAWDYRGHCLLIAAADALGSIRDTRAVGPLIKTFHGQEEPNVLHGARISVTRALGAIGDPRAIVPLCHALADVDWRCGRQPAYIGALELILERSPGITDVEHLHLVASLPDMPGKSYHSDCSYQPSHPVDCTRLKQLARQEMIRRGIEA